MFAFTILQNFYYPCLMELSCAVSLFKVEYIFKNILDEHKIHISKLYSYNKENAM